MIEGTRDINPGGGGITDGQGLFAPGGSGGMPSLGGSDEITPGFGGGGISNEGILLITVRI